MEAGAATAAPDAIATAATATATVTDEYGNRIVTVSGAVASPISAVAGPPAAPATPVPAAAAAAAAAAGEGEGGAAVAGQGLRSIPRESYEAFMDIDAGELESL